MINYISREKEIGKIREKGCLFLCLKNSKWRKISAKKLKILGILLF